MDFKITQANTLSPGFYLSEFNVHWTTSGSVQLSVRRSPIKLKSLKRQCRLKDLANSEYQSYFTSRKSLNDWTNVKWWALSLPRPCWVLFVFRRTHWASHISTTLCNPSQCVLISLLHAPTIRTPHSTVILREYFKNIPLKSCNIARIFIKLVKVYKILQEPCNVRSKYYECNVAAILIFHFNIAVMWEFSSSFEWCFVK